MDEAYANLDERNARLIRMRDRLIEGASKIERSRLNGDPIKRLPGNFNMCFEGIEGESLLLKLDFAGICASSGSACPSGSLDPSHVLLAIGLPHEIAHGSLRMTLSEEVSKEDLDYVVDNSINYPMNVAKVQSAKVVRYDDYVFYVMLGGYNDENPDATEEENVKFAQDQIQLGLDTIASFFEK